MRWLVTGASGQLGSDIVDALRVNVGSLEVWTPHSSELDLSDADGTRSFVADASPDVVINCAAWTNVDGAEIAEARAHVVNALGPKAIAEALRLCGHGLMIQVSTDFVFGQSGPGPHSEDATPVPKSAYARSKRAAELAVESELGARSIIVRTAWLYGVQGSNFVKTVLKRALAGDDLQVVDDQWGQPSSSLDVARRVVALAKGHLSGDIPGGIYHAVNAGSATWFDFAREIVRLLDLDPGMVTPIPSSRLDRAARRPADSRLGDAAAQSFGLPPMRDWREALAEALPEIVRNL